MKDGAREYGETLLAALEVPAVLSCASSDPVVDWASSGAMALTGRPGGPPLISAGPAVAMRGALEALQSRAPDAQLPGLQLLSERAALAGLARRGTVSCGGAARLLPATDGTVCLSLARDEDLNLIPAFVEGTVTDPWAAVSAWLERTTTAVARSRAELLGLPLGVEAEAGPSPFRVTQQRTGTPTTREPLVVDLTSLWAGPLCASLLQVLGCRVVKVEDPTRPDGARSGPRDFFDLLNAGAESLALDLRSEPGRLRDLLLSADVVLESSRPRALGQLGLRAEDLLLEAEGLTWVSITAHGRASSRVGFGDDCAVAGGLMSDGCFVGDAIADPLTGVHAALAAWTGLQRGGSRLVELALARVAATAAASWETDGRTAVLCEEQWHVESAEGLVPVAKPSARSPRGRGPSLATA